MNIFKKNNSKSAIHVGLDIGTSSVKLVELSFRDGTKPLVTAMGLKKIDAGRKEGLSSVIRDLITQARMSPSPVVISMSGPFVVVRFFSMPQMSEDELRSAVKFESEKVMPFGISDCSMDYHILKKKASDNRINILAAAVRNSSIKPRLDMLKDAGLSARAIDIDYLALANAFYSNFPGNDPSKSIALLNVGASFSNLCIIEDSDVAFARDINITSAQQSGEKGVMVFIEELKMSFSYHENQSGRSIDELYLSGGGAKRADIPAALQEFLGFAAKTWDPFGCVELPSVLVEQNGLTDSKAIFAVALGLALR